MQQVAAAIVAERLQMSEEHVQLREYIERIMDEREKTLVLTAKNLEGRLEYLNALREDVLHDRGQFLHKAIYDEMHTAMSDRINRVELFQSKMIGVASVLVILAGILGGIVSKLLMK